jgi:hypothetical protein
VDPRTRRLFAVVLVALVIVVGAVATLAGGTVRDPDAPDGDGAVGIVVGLDSAGLTDVRGFTLRTDDGRDLVFRIGTLENGAEFPPGHLGEHQAFATRIRVWYRSVGDLLVAFRLEDAE